MANAPKLTFKIVTPDGIAYADEIDSVSIPTADGEIGVMPGHVPLLAGVISGELLLKKDGQEIPLSVSSGVLEVRPGSEVYILADSAERAEYIDLERAEAARVRAAELMRSELALEDVDFARLQAKMEKELARLRVGKKYRQISGLNIRRD